MEVEVEGLEQFREQEVKVVGNKVELTKKDYDRLNEDLQIAQLQLQEANDTLNGGITARNMASFRNTYVINTSDSLDDTHPMYVRFSVLDETINIVSIKVSFWIDNYRAYSTGIPSGGGSTTPSGGGSTTPSGGGSTSGAGVTLSWYGADKGASYWEVAGVGSNYRILETSSVSALSNHTHSTPNHTHSTPNHTHSTPDHQHAIADHTHDITFGIYEEDNSPTIKFSVSQDGGVGYSKEYGNVPINQELLDITNSITKTGSKILKFESTTRARLTVQVEVKVDISVR